jgi:hypothetical protein
MVERRELSLRPVLGDQLVDYIDSGQHSQIIIADQNFGDVSCCESNFHQLGMVGL